MSDDPSYTRRQIIDAGKALARRLELNDEAREVFRIAHAWRSSHVEPMHRLRQQLAARARSAPGSVTAARLKRMRSIRVKLARGPQNLLQMQDLAGCRAIVPTMADVTGLVERYRSEQHLYSLLRDTDHVTRAKPDGYRSHHLVLKPTLAGGAVGRQQVELQIRTRLQHAWATAVEAVGLVRGEDMKGGAGDPDWRRFFRLAAADIAIAEGCEPGEGAPPDAAEVSRELRDLSARLKAVDTLERYNLAISQAIEQPGHADRFYLIEYRSGTPVTIRVTSHAALPAGQLSLERADGDDASTVVVEVDRVEDLKTAYPNYFLDLGLFIGHLRSALAPAARTATDVAARTRPGLWVPNVGLIREWWHRRGR